MNAPVPDPALSSSDRWGSGGPDDHSTYVPIAPEVTAAMRRGVEVLSSHSLFGCGCCTWPQDYDEEHPDGCPREDGYTDHTYEGACWQERGRASVLTADILSAALDVEEMAAAIVDHMNTDTLSGDSETLVCACGHVLVTGDPDDDRDPQAEHATHHAALIRTAILGSAS